MRNRTLIIGLMTIGFCFLAQVHAADFTIDWHTIDGGGGASNGGTFELHGTIGQHDAGPPVLAGGKFELTGGFWAAATPKCACLGDMNNDGSKNAADVQQFVDCVLAGGSCLCADVDSMNGVTINDVPVFVADLLNGAACP